MKKARPGLDAQADVEKAVLYYTGQSLGAAQLFIGEYKMTIAAIERMPGTGSPRFAHELGIASLRTRSIHRFPYLIFYFEHSRYIDIVRILHMHRDIPNLLSRDDLL
ncbi:MAG: type II toxin-antitoxin system RelE/ParE family toxin [Patescibacteria group bacterium]